MSSSARDTLLTVLGVIGLIIMGVAVAFGVLSALTGLTILLLAGIFGITFPFWPVLLAWVLLSLVLNVVKGSLS